MKDFIQRHEDKIRYIVAGIWNTIFGYFAFVFLYVLFSKNIHYIVLLIISNIIGITNSYISYKFFVFRTKGNYLKEYLRFYLVYGSSLLLGLILLPIFVEVFKLSPLIGQGVIVIIAVVIGYIGHKGYSFSV